MVERKVNNNIVNPFELTDYRTEQDRNEHIEYVETQGSKFIESLIKNHVSALVIGEKGVGKSSALHVAVENLKEDRKVISVIAPRSLSEIYNELWHKIVGRDSKSLRGYCFEEVSQFLEITVPVNIFPWFKNMCRYTKCRRKERCRFILTGVEIPVMSEVIENIDMITTECPMKRYIIHHTLSGMGIVITNKLKDLGVSFMIDLPDNLVVYNLSSLDVLLPRLQVVGSVVILSTEKQFQLCKQSEILTRLNILSYPLSTKKECINMIRCRERNDKVLSDEIITKIVDMSCGYPRKLIQLCSNEIFGYEKYEGISQEDKAIKLVIEKLKREGRLWVKVQEIRKDLKNNFMMDISSERLGRKLSNDYLLEKRYNPTAEYKIC